MYLLKVPRKSFTNDTGGGERQMRLRSINCRPNDEEGMICTRRFPRIDGESTLPRIHTFLPRKYSSAAIYINGQTFQHECAHRRLQMFVRNRRFMDTCLYETSVRLHERWTNWHSMKRNIVLHLWAIMRVIVRPFLGV